MVNYVFTATHYIAIFVDKIDLYIATMKITILQQAIMIIFFSLTIPNFTRLWELMVIFIEMVISQVLSN